MNQKVWVDPPSGHMYGFPKIWDPNENPDFLDWLVKEGYPQELTTPADTFYFRYWAAE
jgi:hypothetical protein